MYWAHNTSCCISHLCSGAICFNVVAQCIIKQQTINIDKSNSNQSQFLFAMSIHFEWSFSHLTVLITTENYWEAVYNSSYASRVIKHKQNAKYVSNFLDILAFSNSCKQSMISYGIVFRFVISLGWWHVWAACVISVCAHTLEAQLYICSQYYLRDSINLRQSLIEAFWRLTHSTVCVQE